MVAVPVGEQDPLAAEAMPLQVLQQGWVLQTGVHHQAQVRVAAMEYVAVLVVGGVDHDTQIEQITEAVGRHAGPL